jgi:hypothetical protein
MIEIDGKLCMWTVYEHPADSPNRYVARLFVLDEPSEAVLVAATLEDLRRFIERVSPGLICIPRQPGDEPHIVEVWL